MSIIKQITLKIAKNRIMTKLFRLLVFFNSQYNSKILLSNEGSYIYIYNVFNALFLNVHLKIVNIIIWTNSIGIL